MTPPMPKRLAMSGIRHPSALNPPPPKPNPEPIRLLGLLQREARLLDFLMENLSAYTDDQIGASVRDIQVKSQSVIVRRFGR